MSDDAEFDAFLKGEDALSRRLQAMPQAVPNAALDAAILQRARDMMAQELRPAAANDAGQAVPAPRPGRLSWRWRVPAGIAAAVLTGVFAHQAFQSSMEMESRVGMPAEESAPVLSPTPAAADRDAPAPKVSMPEYPSAAPAQPSKPAPKVRSRMAAAPAAEPIQGVDKINSAPPAPAPAPVPAAPAPMAAAPVLAPPSSLRSNDTLRDAVQQRLSAAKTEKAQVSGARIKAESAAMAPAVWLADIEALLGAGKDTEALEAWRQFRQAYPDYPVPETIRDQIKAIQK